MRLSMKQNRKKKKKVMLWSIVGLTMIAFLVSPFIFKSSAAGFDEEKAATGDITTYYSFSGIVEPKSRQNIFSTKEMHINAVLVKEGDQVKKNDVLLKTSSGEIKADIDGEVAKIYTKNNTHAVEGTQLMEIADYTNIQTKVKVDEYDLDFLEVNKKVKVTINALNKEVNGIVSAISKEAQNENGVSYFTATIDLEKDKAIRPGMSAEAKILNENATGVTILPMKAIQFDSKNKPYVLIRAEKEKPARKYIQTGINDGTVIEIKSGVKAGDVIMIPKTTSKEDSFEHGGAADSEKTTAGER
ncbi:RND transporter [Bacillus methanolicus]|nr:RND transporter [Bacillus methanolicus]